MVERNFDTEFSEMLKIASSVISLKGNAPNPRIMCRRKWQDKDLCRHQNEMKKSVTPQNNMRKSVSSQNEMNKIHTPITVSTHPCTIKNERTLNFIH